MDIATLINIIQDDGRCTVLPADNQYTLPEDIPEDVKLFFTMTDGILLFEDEVYSIRISGRSGFQPINTYLFPDIQVDIAEPSHGWYLVATSEQLSQYISIDLSEKKHGQCYDCFFETYALVGQTPIIAKNFTELLYRLYEGKGQYWYWLKDDFIYLGDAYDTV